MEASAAGAGLPTGLPVSGPSAAQPVQAQGGAAGALGTAALAALAAEAQVDQAVLAAALADGSEIVFGAPADDGGFAKVVRRVVVLAALAATYYMCHSISDLVRGQYSSENSGNVTSLWSAVSTLTIELSIPACGYYGALHGNRQLTCCFCSCNLFVAMVTVMQFIRIELRIGEIDGQCEREQDGQQRRTCEVWTSDGPEKYLTLFNLIVVICLGCLAFWFGNSLYQRLAQDFAGGGGAPAPVPLVGEVISLASVGVAGDSLQLVQPPAADGEPERAASASGVEVVVPGSGPAGEAIADVSSSGGVDNSFASASRPVLAGGAATTDSAASSAAAGGQGASDPSLDVERL